MNKLPLETRVQILSMLCEGSSMRSISRMCDVSINTVSKLLVDAGNACAAFHDSCIRNVTSQRIQVDEIWSFTYAKEKQVKTAKAAPQGAGDTWTWTAIDADSKLIVSYLVADRTWESAHVFMEDLSDRLANRVQLTSDGHRSYLNAVKGAFGSGVDYAQLDKIYGPPPRGPEARYSPPVCVGTKRRPVIGNPDPDHISTSYVERSNLTMRMHMRRFTRLTNAFSKKFENHMHMVALYTVWYNFVKMHKTLRMTPTMASGVVDKLWSMKDVAEMIDATLPAPGKRGPYKKQVAENSN
jgi:IS1 family transposase